MAHEITKTDGLVLAGKGAWHGLGTVVEHAPTPTEALKLAGLDWSVEQVGLWREDDGAKTELGKLNVRSDTREELGLVGPSYQPVQNADLAAFAQALAQQGDVTRVESAGSIRGGKRVWFLLRGASFSVRPNDDMHTYILLANGHDGTLSVWVQPTSIRVVCSNTLHYAFGRGASTAIRFRHEGDIATKLDDAKRALGLYQKSTDGFVEATRAMSGREMTREQLQAFYTAVYAKMFSPIPTNPTTKAEQKAHDKAVEAVSLMAQNFDADRAKTGAGPTLWTAFNAATEFLQHQTRSTGKDDAARHENRVFSDTWGMIATRKAKAFDHALQLV